jgi:hypothetical protein
MFLPIFPPPLEASASGLGPGRPHHAQVLEDRPEQPVQLANRFGGSCALDHLTEDPLQYFSNSIGRPVRGFGLPGMGRGALPE